MTGCGICGAEYDTYGAFVACFGCCKLFHSKCAKLNKSCADVLQKTNTNGLQWFCVSCRSLSTSVLCTKLANFQKAVDKLDSLAQGLMGLSSQLRIDFTELTNFISKSNAIKPSSGTTQDSVMRTRQNSCLSHDVMSPPTSVIPVIRVDSSPAAPITSLSPADNPTDASFNAAIVSNTDPASTSATAVTPAPPFTAPGATATSVSTVTAASNSGTASSTALASTLPSSLLSTNPVQLVVVSRTVKKSIFVSRLATDTSEQNILDYIVSRINMGVDLDKVYCRKFKFNGAREVSSFKITPPEVLFHQLLSSDFWPPGVIIHEFVVRPRRQAHQLASPVPLHSKNY